MLPLMAGYIGQATGATFQMRQPGAATAAVVTTTANATAPEADKPAARENGASAAPTEDGMDVGIATTEPSASAGKGRGLGAEGGGAVAGGGGGGMECPAELTLITRLGVGRPLAGSWRRGLDMAGHAAGFAETEVLLTVWQPEEQQQQQAGAGGEQGQGDAAAAAAEAAAEAAASAGVGADGVFRKRSRVAVASYVMVGARQGGMHVLLTAGGRTAVPCVRQDGELFRIVGMTRACSARDRQGGP